MAGRTKKRILVADDTLPMRVMLQDVLQEAGYEVITAVDGEEAWNVIQEQTDQLDLLILDLLMPRMTGFEILEKLPQIKRPPHQKVLMITGIFKSAKEIDRLRDLGAAGYITKSALVDEILFRVNQVFHLGRENSRRYPRVLYSLPVDYWVGEQQLSNYSSNFSAGGIFIRTIDPAPPNELIDISFSIPELNEQIETTGKVVWANEYESGAKKPSLPGMGVQFLDLDASLRNKLEEFVKQKLAAEPLWLENKPG